VRFFFDNCLPPALAKAIHVLSEREYGHDVVHLRQMFPDDTPDVDWLTKLGVEGDWVVISGDLRITRNKHERAKWLEAEITAFFLSPAWSNLTFWEQAWKLIKQWPLIVDQSHRIEPGAGFEVKPTSSKLKQIRIQ